MREGSVEAQLACALVKTGSFFHTLCQEFMEPFGVSVGYLKVALVPQHAEQIPCTPVQRGAAAAVTEAIFDRHAQIGFDVPVDEIRQLPPD
jgi:ornithine carbamoyltransferase